MLWATFYLQKSAGVDRGFPLGGSHFNRDRVAFFKPSIQQRKASFAISRVIQVTALGGQSR